jgi:small-conductance mechanosensitive channel
VHVLDTAAPELSGAVVAFQLTEAWSVFAAAMLVWILATAAVYFVGRVALRWLTRRSPTRLDDIIAHIVAAPVILLMISYGSLSSWEAAYGESAVTNALQRIHSGLLIVVGVYVAWRVLFEVIVTYLRPVVQESDNQADDIIIPLLSRIGPVLITIAGLNALVAALGGDLTAWIAGIGLLGLVLGYLFQEPLQGLFSGTYLALDSPFRTNDLLILGDGTLCQVYNIGIRVTQLYDIKRRNLMYVPNSTLIGDKIVNVTKPSVEQRASLTVTMDRAMDPKTAMALLLEACNGHENILGDWEEKRAAILSRRATYEAELRTLPDAATALPTDRTKRHWLESQTRRLTGELVRLEVEHILRERGEHFSEALLRLMQSATLAEQSGFDQAEQTRLRAMTLDLMDQFDRLIEQITVWLYLVQVIQYEMSDPNYHRYTERLADGGALQDGALTLAELHAVGAPGAPLRPMVVRDDLTSPMSSQDAADRAVDRTHFRDRSHYADFQRLYTIWHRNILQVYRGLYRVYELRALRSAEWHLDEQVKAVERAFATNFLLRIGGWQMPEASLVDIAAGALTFRVEVSIDDVVREQFQRSDRVIAELLMEIDRVRGSYQISITNPGQLVGVSSQ